MALEGQCGGLPKVPNLHVLIRLPCLRTLSPSLSFSFSFSFPFSFPLSQMDTEMLLFTPKVLAPLPDHEIYYQSISTNKESVHIASIIFFFYLFTQKEKNKICNFHFIRCNLQSIEISLRIIFFFFYFNQQYNKKCIIFSLIK